MSLVDYASSSDEDEATEIGEKKNVQNENLLHDVAQCPLPSQGPSQAAASSINSNLSMRESSDPQQTSVSQLPAPSFEKLPDASFLLSSPTLPNPLSVNDHSSRVAAAMAENASRKREGNGSTTRSQLRKLPRGNLPHSKNIPETSGGLLVPPQLGGRSNVVTEDVSKLFVRKQGTT